MGIVSPTGPYREGVSICFKLDKMTSQSRSATRQAKKGNRSRLNEGVNRVQVHEMRFRAKIKE